MSTRYEGTFFEVFGVLCDKRQQGKVQHKLADIMFILVSGFLSGCNELAEFSIWLEQEEQLEWLSKYISLENGVPSIPTLRRILSMIDPKQFERTFSSWMKSVTVLSAEGGDTIALDGKTMRGSRDGDRVTHIVSAWCSANNLVLGQVKTDEKSNEITAIPELLDLLYLKGCVVTADAMACQKDIVRKIMEKDADYLISLKGNQGTIHQEVKDYFEGEAFKIQLDDPSNEKIGTYETIEKGHGRIEERFYTYSTDIEWMVDAKKDWYGLTGIGMVTRRVTEKGITSEETQFHIGSIDNVKQYAKSAREHWGIEAVHWSLDVTFRDDANTTRKDVAPQNMAVIKRMVLNTLRSDKEFQPKKSVNKRRFLAGLNIEYRTQMINKLLS